MNQGRAIATAFAAMLFMPGIVAWILIAFDHPETPPSATVVASVAEPLQWGRHASAERRTSATEGAVSLAHAGSTLGNPAAGDRGTALEPQAQRAVWSDAATAAYVLPMPRVEGVPVVGLPVETPLTSPKPVPPAPGQTSIAYQPPDTVSDGVRLPSNGAFPVAPVAALSPVILPAPDGEMPLLWMGEERMR